MLSETSRSLPRAQDGAPKSCVAEPGSDSKPCGETPEKLVVGLTGGLACGKSAVSVFFKTLGIGVVDADEISRQLTAAEGMALNPIRKAFGDSVFCDDKTLNRKALRDLVFNNHKELRKLEAILHPLIRKRCSEEIAACDSPYVLLSVPLLLKSPDLKRLCSRILVIDVPAETQIERACLRDGISEKLALSIVSQQSSREELLEAADDIIENTYTADSLRTCALKLHAFYVRLATVRLL